MSSASFGRDHGLIHEAVITGRKAGWGSDQWAKLAHSEKRMREIGGYLKGTSTIVPIKQEKKPKLLKPDGHYAAVQLAERHDPDTFWNTRSGLYVGGDFRDRIVAVAKPTETGAKWKKLPRFKLERGGSGEEMKSARPNGIWTATDFCPWLAAKLAKQPNGEDGEFLTNGLAALFLVEGVNGEAFVVRVRWRRGGRRWLVNAWPLGFGWRAVDSFGSRN